MGNPQCATCAYETLHGELDYTKSNSALARQLRVNEASIRRHRRHVGEQQQRPAPKREAQPVSEGNVEVGPDGGEFRDIKSSQPITDWTDIFHRFNLDPTIFEIQDDTVRMSMWQQSKRTENGDRDVINLFSYRARFRRRTQGAITEADITAAQQRARAWKLPRRTPGTGLGEPVAAVLNLADFQLGKSEGGGVDATLDRIYDGLENFHREIERQRRHHNLNELVIVNNGDPFEGIAGNYASQTHTVQTGLRGQMNLVLDVWSTYARELYPLFDKAQFVSVLCNHTEFGRQGGSSKSITSDSDNGGAFLAETLQRVLNVAPGLDHVQFTIPHDEMNVYTEAAGIPIGFNHGHKIPGNDATGFERWLNGQARGDQRAHEARIWVTAHRHNFQAWDLGSTFAFSCPSCDGGSKWLRDTTGRYSRSGIVSFLVGNHHQLGWSDVAFL